MYFDYYGKNVRDALNNALRRLKVKESDIEYQVIDKGGLFRKAIIRARPKEPVIITQNPSFEIDANNEELKLNNLEPKRKENLYAKYISPFDGIKNLEKYLNFGIDIMNIENQTNVNCVLNGFEYYSENDERYVKGRFYYAGNTFVFLGDDGSKVFSNIMPFVFLNVKKRYFYGKMSIDVNGTYYHFDNECDEEIFLRYVKEYNEFIGYMISEAQKNCVLIYNELIQNQEVTNAIQNFLDMFPEVLFVDYELYCTFLHEFCFRDEITKNYLKFSQLETDKAIEVLCRKGNQAAFQEAWNLVVNLQNLLIENFPIQENCANLVTYMLINYGLIERYSAIWEKDYDNSLDVIAWEDYIQHCYNDNILVADDFRGITALTYALLKGDKDEIIGYRFKYNAVIEKLANAINFKQKDDFARRIFSDRKHQDTEERSITIEDIDLMNGMDFEQFICKLFTKMGYSSYVTKASGDQGLDVIAEKDGMKIGIQAKCYSNSVGNSAIQEAVAGKQIYMCNRVLVVTNNYFTKSAIELAVANGVTLWDRDTLCEKIKVFL